MTLVRAYSSSKVPFLWCILPDCTAVKRRRHVIHCMARPSLVAALPAYAVTHSTGPVSIFLFPLSPGRVCFQPPSMQLTA